MSLRRDALRSNRSRQKPQHARRRHMRFESLEVRNLMAQVVAGEIGTPPSPTGMEEYFSQQIEKAFIQASDLSKYTPESIAAATRWVLHLGEDASASALIASLGSQYVTATTLIEDTYIYTLPAGTSRENIGTLMQSLTGVQYAYPLTPHDLQKMFVPNDTLYPQQWHLNNIGQNGGTPGEDANLEGAWDLATGQGVVIGIVDDGVEYTHPDLAANYLPALALDVVNNDNDPAPTPGNGDFHGTSVAGVAAGVGNNNLGTTGAAPEANFTGIKFLGGPVDDLGMATMILHENQAIDIYNNSWGYNAHYIQIGPLFTAALQTAVTAGRGGLGSILAFANGNGFMDSDDGNYSSIASSWWTLAVAALDHRGGHSYYSTPGANLLISAHSNSGQSGVVTTDITGADGYNWLPGGADGDPLSDLNYTSTFGGTSSATPLVSGVIALMLEVNPNLTWRDVQHILVRTARKNDAAHVDWTTNGAGWHVNHWYGFGAIDAEAAVTMASNWTNVAAAQVVQSTVVNVNQAIPDGSGSLDFTFNITNSIRLEQVELLVDIQHSAPEDLEIILTSPDGTSSVLTRSHFDPLAFGTLEDWGLRSTRHWDELAQGTWRISVRDKVGGTAGTFNSFQFNMLGTTTTAQPTGGTIQGTAFADTNSNGVFDVNEVPLSNVTVFIDANSNGVRDAGERMTKSNDAGVYTFRGLTAGTYVVDVAPNPTQAPTFPANHVIALAANATVVDRNFGVRDSLTSNGPYTLTNGTGDGDVTIGVDGYGSFGRAIGPYANDAFYNPIGAIASAGTTFESGVALGLNQGARTFLSTGINGPYLGTFANPRVTGNNLSGSSSFVIGNLLFELQQTLAPMNDVGGSRSGTELTQSYRITNLGTETTNFDLVRYFDGDLDFDGSLIDGGGRLIVNNNEILFETDSAAGTSNATTFVGITARGGGTSALTRYEADHWDDLLNKISVGGYLDQIITNDGPDADQFVDAGQGYDITLALQNIFVLAPGQSTFYVTSTIFGTGAPADISPPIPPPPPPPPPMSISGVVMQDFNLDGLPSPGEPGLPNAVVYLDLNGDGKLGLGEPAQITNNRGEYSFVVNAGSYVVRQAPLAGWVPTGPMGHAYSVNGEAGEAISNLYFGNAATIDFGDAPAPYPTLAVHGGPSHSVLPGMHLGYSIDGEGDGQPHSKANGDDNSLVDDDDGVKLLTPMTPGQNATAQVIVQSGGRATGRLNGWIDFNGDGDWNDAGEQIFKDLAVTEGVNNLSFPVPAGAQLGNTFGRFRYGYGVDILPTGNVLGGEVEDYLLAVVGPKPIAKPDVFEIGNNSVKIPLDVLANDIASSLGAISILSVSAGSRNGTIAINPIDNTLLYTPVAGTLGIETFTYTITDFRGGTATAQVTVNLVAPFIHPIAMDDQYSVAVNSVSNYLHLTANDLVPGEPLTSLTVAQQTSQGGYVAVNANTFTVRYTPPVNFTGVDQFQYTIRDARGLQSTATVTVRVGDDTADDVASLMFSITDTNGAPLTEVNVGDEFQLHVMIEDIRNAPTDPGVLSAYLDVLYSQGLIAPKSTVDGLGFEVAFATDFDLNISGTATQAGLINELGASRSTAPTAAGPERLLSITFVALAAGQAKFIADPADLTSNRVQVGTSGISVPIDRVTYGTTSLNIVTSGAQQSPQAPATEKPPQQQFKNSDNAYDVNGDSSVTPLDALLVINHLNSVGTHSLAGMSRGSAHFIDVSGDDQLTPLDALLIINFLNAKGSTQLVSGEDDSSLIEAATPLDEATSPAGVQWLPLDDSLSTDTSDNDGALSTQIDTQQFVTSSTSSPVEIAPWLVGDDDATNYGSSTTDEDEDLFDLIAADVADAW